MGAICLRSPTRQLYLFGDFSQEKRLNTYQIVFQKLVFRYFQTFLYHAKKGERLKQFILTTCPIGRIPFRFSSPLFLEIGFLSPYFVSQFANREQIHFILGVFHVWQYYLPTKYAFFLFSLFRNNSVRSFVRLRSSLGLHLSISCDGTFNRQVSLCSILRLKFLQEYTTNLAFLGMAKLVNGPIGHPTFGQGKRRMNPVKAKAPLLSCNVLSQP